MSRPLTRVLHVASLGSLLSCAAIAPPAPSQVPTTTPLLRCEPLRGTSEGLLFRMSIEPGLPDTAILALYRDDAEVVAFPLSDVAPPPAELLLGDAGVAAGSVYRYTCVAWGEDDAVLAQSGVALSIPGSPERPAAPTLESTASGVRVTWTGEPSTFVRVYRRDVLGDGSSTVVSPALLEPGWLDASVVPGGVYAYALQSAVLRDGIPWESDLGSERYIETAVSP